MYQKVSHLLRKSNVFDRFMQQSLYCLKILQMHLNPQIVKVLYWVKSIHIIIKL